MALAVSQRVKRAARIVHEKDKGARLLYVIDEEPGKSYLARYGKNAQGAGWLSFDHNGVHYIGLVNVLDLKAGGLGNLGSEQLEWLQKDVQGLSSSTPIVVLAHIPLWTVYPEWGWGTDDGAKALSMLKKFGSVTVLNGHIHQIMQKVEGNVAFHTARSTAFPQPAPGTAPSPGPLKVPAGELRNYLGIASVTYLQTTSRLPSLTRRSPADPSNRIFEPLLDFAGSKAMKTHVSLKPLSSFVTVILLTISLIAAARAQEKPAGNASAPSATVRIGNFSFTPAEITVAPGTTVTWTNGDDIPHTVTATSKAFRSKAMDTDQHYSFTFTAPGTYEYFCSLHPHMQGKVIVK